MAENTHSNTPIFVATTERELYSKLKKEKFLGQ